MTINLPHLRRQAKQLKRAVVAGDRDALARTAAVFSDDARRRSPSDPSATAGFRHADALHVIAREQGFASWPRLKLAVELAQMDREARAQRLGVALFYGQHWVVEALLKEDPSLAAANLGLRAALYDRAGVEAALAADPSAATRAVGRRRPMLHLAFSQHIHAAPALRDDMLAVAAALAAAGADVNDGFPPEPGSEHRLSALYGAIGHADNMALGAWLLERGADPNDNESLYHATELGHHQGLKLLLSHGAKADGTNALPRALDFNDLEAVRLLLEAGADPNEGIAPHPSGQPATTIPALHQAARRRASGEIAAALIAHGADGRALYRGHSAYAFARMFANQPVATALEAAGQATALDAAEALLAAAAEGGVEGRLEPEQLTEETRRIMGRVLGFGGDLAHAKRLHAIGIDPNWTDEMGLPAIHIAGWEGLPEAVAWLLDFEPDLAFKNDYGGDLLGTIIHGAEFAPARAERDHLTCARLVLAEGAPLRQAEIDGCGAEELAGFLADWAEDHPGQVVKDA